MVEARRFWITGLAEAGLAEAAQGGRRFSIVTVTPELDDCLRASALLHGSDGEFASIRYTNESMADVLRTPGSLEKALLQVCGRAASEDGAQAVVIGGSLLAQGADSISAALQLPVINPVAAAARLAYRRGRSRRAR